jgi:hypothetical protein
MRVCLHPASCPFGTPDSALDSQLDRWSRALTASLPGDASLVSALIGDIAVLAG